MGNKQRGHWLLYAELMHAIKPVGGDQALRRQPLFIYRRHNRSRYHNLNLIWRYNDIRREIKLS